MNRSKINGTSGPAAGDTTAGKPGAGGAGATPPGCESCSGTSGFIMILLGMFTVMILFDFRLRVAAAQAIGFVFNPLIGFDINLDGAGDFPIWTLFCAGMILVAISTAIRHYFMDWVEMARVQKRMAAFNKELRDARLTGDTLKEKKLRDMQSEMMGMQSSMSTNQMKPMVFTMLLAISIFTWLWMLFIAELEPKTITLPWAPYWQLQDNPYLFPNWILIYSLFSIPTGQLMQRALKYYSFKRKLQVSELDQHKRTLVAIDAAREMVENARETGADVNAALQALRSAERAFEEKKYQRAVEYAREAEDEAERFEHKHSVAMDRINDARKVVENVSKDGIVVDKAEALLARAKEALDAKNYSSVLNYTREAKKLARDVKSDHKHVSGKFEDIYRMIDGAKEQGIDTKRAVSEFDKAQEAMGRGDFEEAEDHLKDVEVQLFHTQKQRLDAKTLMEETQRVIRDASDMNIDLSPTMDLFTQAEHAFKREDYSESVALFRQVKKQIEKAVGEYSETEEALSFAKLVIANARDFGGDVHSAEAYLKKAENAFTRGNYRQAIEFANQAKSEAEGAKAAVKKTR